MAEDKEKKSWVPAPAPETSKGFKESQGIGPIKKMIRKMREGGMPEEEKREPSKAELREESRKRAAEQIKKEETPPSDRSHLSSDPFSRPKKKAKDKSEVPFD